VADMRHYLSKYGGNLGESGCVSWMFEKKGLIVVNSQNASEDDLMMLVLDAGADDMRVEDSTFEITTQPENFEAVKKVIEEHKIPIESAEITMIPKNTIKLEGNQAERLLKLMEILEEHDDTQNVYANFDIDFEKMEQG
ncbi:YebC/PmpR family DNA-binding transcriptional regulator, partial [candidate division KSB1 bacterium]|nr:YebC/PmpR family DNA-binding transcriptional regulator [candidate division KSB1 bacterium]